VSIIIGIAGHINPEDLVPKIKINFQDYKYIVNLKFLSLRLNFQIAWPMKSTSVTVNSIPLLAKGK
jgi:hypothetical protein